VQIRSEAFDDLGAPAGPILAFKNVAADAPVEENELAIHCEDSPHLGRSNPLLQVSQKIFAAFGAYGL